MGNGNKASGSRRIDVSMVRPGTLVAWRALEGIVFELVTGVDPIVSSVTVNNGNLIEYEAPWAQNLADTWNAVDDMFKLTVLFVPRGKTR